MNRNSKRKVKRQEQLLTELEHIPETVTGIVIEIGTVTGTSHIVYMDEFQPFMFSEINNRSRPSPSSNTFIFIIALWTIFLT